jgi:hypothetical protein
MSRTIVYSLTLVKTEFFSFNYFLLRKGRLKNPEICFIYTVRGESIIGFLDFQYLHTNGIWIGKRIL